MVVSLHCSYQEQVFHRAFKGEELFLNSSPLRLRLLNAMPPLRGQGSTTLATALPSFLASPLLSCPDNRPTQQSQTVHRGKFLSSDMDSNSATDNIKELFYPDDSASTSDSESVGWSTNENDGLVNILFLRRNFRPNYLSVSIVWKK